MERLVDLSHVIEEGMTTFKGFPWPDPVRLLDRRNDARQAVCKPRWDN
jgi:kynurenine formamidase